MGDPAVTITMDGLQEQRRRLGPRLDAAIDAVVHHGRFILGPEVAELEEKLARHCGVSHAIGCSSGTDALLLALLARGVGRGDAVFVPAFTFAATAEVVVLAGATPVFVDVRHDTFNLDVASLAAAAEWSRGAGLRPAGVIAVDLFGQPADYDAIGKIAAEEGMWVLADAAQSLGGSLGGRPVGALADVTATSFFPAKPLGCYGDGGAVLTDDGAMAVTIRSLRAHGQGADKDDSAHIGMNSRLDTLQAAILLVKLEVFAEELALRQSVARRYTECLAGVVGVPSLVPGATSAWACYTVLGPERDRLRQHLRDAGIATALYYSTPLHQRTAYRRYPTAPGGLVVAERLSREVLSLPIHPYLDVAGQDRVIDAVRAGVGTRR